MDALPGSRWCRTDFCLIRCLCRRHPFRSQAEGCPCLCTRAHTLGRIVFLARCRKIIHQDLAVVKDRHPGVNRFVENELAFVHVDSDQVV